MSVIASTILKDAAGLVDGPRANSHGDKRTNMQNTADIWNAMLRIKLRIRANLAVSDLLDPVDVANMMEAFKIARRYSGAHNIDDYLDGAGYAAVAGEIADALNLKGEKP